MFRGVRRSRAEAGCDERSACFTASLGESARVALCETSERCGAPGVFLGRAQRALVGVGLGEGQEDKSARARLDESAVEPETIMPTQTKNARSSRAEAKPRAGGPSPAKSASASPRGSGAGGTAESPASSAPAPTAPSKASRSRQSPAKKLTDLPSTG